MEVAFLGWAGTKLALGQGTSCHLSLFISRRLQAWPWACSFSVLCACCLYTQLADLLLRECVCVAGVWEGGLSVNEKKSKSNTSGGWVPVLR